MVFRVFQGIGFGAEWGVGAVLVAELVRPESRGQALGVVQSAWAAGWALAVVAYLIAFELFAETTAWRVLMCLGILPALLILYVRSRVEDPEVFKEARDREQVPLKEILSGQAAEDDGRGVDPRHRHPGRLLRDVHLDPDVPEEGARADRRGHERLPVRGHRGRVPGLPVRGLGARPARASARVRAVRGVGGRVAGRVLPGAGGSNSTLLLVGFPLGFFASGCFSGLRLLPGGAVPDARARAPAGASVTTSAAASARCSRASSASSPRRSGSAARSPSASSATCWRSCALAFLPETGRIRRDL